MGLKMNQFKLLFYRTLLVLWVLGIFYVSFSSNPTRDFPAYKTVGAEVLHFTAFFVLVFLFYFSFPLKRVKGLVMSFIFSFTVSALKEFGQLFIPNRTAGLEDLMVDMVSILFGVLVIDLINKVKIGYSNLRKAWN
ncbi:MAG: VanZ family protein [Candidatus Saganbacteria bacterium]|nr:VanZ family protein [Candidatus Saganbacteria bacterium]